MKTNTDANHTSIACARNISIVIFITLLSKCFGFLRDMVLAYFYGATNVSDAYLISLTIPEFLFNIVTQAIAVGFIPIFMEISHKENEQKANQFTNQVLSILYLSGTFVFLMIHLFPRVFILFFAKGFDEPTIALTTEFVRITAAAIFFKGTSSVLSAYCHAKGEFTRPALIGLPLDIIVILSIYLGYVFHSVVLAYGTVLAYASQLLFVGPFCLKKGFRLRFFLSLHDPYTKKMIALFLPLLLGVGANQINILVDRTLASTISTGAISALNYANKIDNIMENVIVLSIAGVMYPVYSSFAAKKDYSSLGGSLQSTLDEVLLLMLPITIGSILFARPIVALLFGHGVFDGEAIQKTSMAMIGYSLGMVGVSYRAILTRAFYSLQDVKTPVINSAISVVINIILNLILSRYFQIFGLALASSIASITCSSLMLFQLRRTLPIHFRRLTMSFLKILVVSLFAGTLAFLTFHVFKRMIHIYASMFLSVVISALFYWALAFVLHLPGISGISDLLKHIFGNRFARFNRTP